ncbi:RNA 2',3'-cyclic phosphodiesterase [Neptuniibacter sp. QD34_54]|uniref:RNA 2',3'-cyclic phosphodiesterase n=1 Tax=Neptuniibacter sp. QD34_54 TaxID=3398208 RepID=UPI0039F4E515
MRLFLAIDLPEDLQDRITELYCPELEQVRWTVSHQLHITLVFIGDQPHQYLEEIIEAVSETSFEPFELCLQKIGYFKSGIIWLGVEESEPLKRLQKSLSHKVRGLGIELEQRKYMPHITLGRSKKLTPQVVSQVSHKGLGFTANMVVSAFQLKSSVLKANGAEYLTEGEFLPD